MTESKLTFDMECQATHSKSVLYAYVLSKVSEASFND